MNLESLLLEIASEKYLRFAELISWRALFRYFLKSDHSLRRLLLSRNLCMCVISGVNH